MGVRRYITLPPRGLRLAGRAARGPSAGRRPVADPPAFAAGRSTDRGGTCTCGKPVPTTRVRPRSSPSTAWADRAGTGKGWPIGWPAPEVIAPDLAGFGRSEEPTLDADRALHLGDLDAVIEATAPSSPVWVIGHSLGGVLAALWASDRHERWRVWRSPLRPSPPARRWTSDPGRPAGLTATTSDGPGRPHDLAGDRGAGGPGARLPARHRDRLRPAIHPQPGLDLVVAVVRPVVGRGYEAGRHARWALPRCSPTPAMTGRCRSPPRGMDAPAPARRGTRDRRWRPPVPAPHRLRAGDDLAQNIFWNFVKLPAAGLPATSFIEAAGT